MARTADRATELSIRSALGASRARLSQQLLTECVLLSLAACFAGLFVAFWTASIAAKVQPAAIASQAYSILDGRVLCFAIAVSVISGLLFGVLPSLYAGRVHTFGTARLQRLSRLAAGSRSAGRGAGRAHDHACCRFAFRGARVSASDAGQSGVCTGRSGHRERIAGRDHPSGRRAAGLAYFEEVLARVRRLPGVRSASATEFSPAVCHATSWEACLRWTANRTGSTYRWFRCSRTTSEPWVDAFWRDASSLPRKYKATPRSLIVNERFAAEFGSAADALGHQVVPRSSENCRRGQGDGL